MRHVVYIWTQKIGFKSCQLIFPHLTKFLVFNVMYNQNSKKPNWKFIVKLITHYLVDCSMELTDGVEQLCIVLLGVA